MSNSNILADWPFIISNDAKKTDSESRKLIRSHVMLGKNSKRGKRSKTRDHEMMGAVADYVNRAAFAMSYPLAIPQKVGSDVSFSTFPDRIDPQAAAEALKCKLMPSLRGEPPLHALT